MDIYENFIADARQRLERLAYWNKISRALVCAVAIVYMYPMILGGMVIIDRTSFAWLMLLVLGLKHYRFPQYRLFGYSSEDQELELLEMLEEKLRAEKSQQLKL